MTSSPVPGDGGGGGDGSSDVEADVSSQPVNVGAAGTTSDALKLLGFSMPGQMADRHLQLDKFEVVYNFPFGLQHHIFLVHLLYAFMLSPIHTFCQTVSNHPYYIDPPQPP